MSSPVTKMQKTLRLYVNATLTKKIHQEKKQRRNFLAEDTRSDSESQLNALFYGKLAVEFSHVKNICSVV